MSDEPRRPIYRRKRLYFLLIFLILALCIGLNYKTVKHHVGDASKALLTYAENAHPFTAGLILGLVGVADSSFLSLPEGNDFLIVYFSINKPGLMPWFVLVSALGSLAGSLVLFTMGRKGGEMFLTKRFSPERVVRIQTWFKKYGIWAILLPCIVPPPMPFKLFVLTAGVLKFKYSRFMLATFIGRLVRYGIWGVLAILFKDYIKDFMKHYLLELGVAILVLLLIVGFGSYLYAWLRRRKRPAPAEE